jgi:hypothetical protein
MGLPLEPVVCDEDEAPDVPGDAKGAATKLTEVADKDPGEEREEEAAPAEGQ